MKKTLYCLSFSNDQKDISYSFVFFRLLCFFIFDSSFSSDSQVVSCRLILISLIQIILLLLNGLFIIRAFLVFIC
ncbi:hypothetical protein BDA99DRAFT_498092 [Phascolomyces articulosus]|uniref:Uncharacterized protein n=1 Tax=Phascolomyces articulosus TaxID=60185 RepID=A0AAD5K8N1_9FUNG|nr:hypothetical protein BDA99DRAFT_498092 [Phascolomyces articulosus]